MDEVKIFKFSGLENQLDRTFQDESKESFYGITFDDK